MKFHPLRDGCQHFPRVPFLRNSSEPGGCNEEDVARGEVEQEADEEAGRRSPRRDRWKAVHEMCFLKIVGYVLMRGLTKDVNHRFLGWKK